MRWIAVLSVAVLSLSACGGEDADPKTSSEGRGACALVSADRAASTLDVDTVTSADESKALGGGPSTVLTCRWTGPGEGPALLVVAREAGSQTKAAAQVAPATATCDGASDLTIDGVTGYACPGSTESSGPEVRAAWDTMVVTVSLTTSRTGPQGADAVERLEKVVGDLHSSLSAQSFAAGS